MVSILFYVARCSCCRVIFMHIFKTLYWCEECEIQAGRTSPSISIKAKFFFFFCLIEFNSIQCRCQWEVCVADATATHSLSNLALLMMFSSSQTITRETPTDKGNMSSFSCQEGLWALDVQTPSTASKMDDLKTGAELWDFVV